jgi:hypothetical protein
VHFSQFLEENARFLYLKTPLSRPWALKASDDRQGDKTDEAEARQDEFLLQAK